MVKRIRQIGMTGQEAGPTSAFKDGRRHSSYFIPIALPTTARLIVDPAEARARLRRETSPAIRCGSGRSPLSRRSAEGV